MQIVKSIAALRQIVTTAKRNNQRIGFIPTMGALHEGHLSLIRKCKEENNLVILSIFVNPKQFGPAEDLKSYPREKKYDELLAKKEKTDIIFFPSDKLMYPRSFLTNIHVEQLSEIMCGKYRRGHFDGVATVVAKLLNIVLPDTLYLGQKDAQQAIILKQMIADLNFPITVRICPIVREKDGLAMSSRNRYLNQMQRQEASIIYRTLKSAKKYIQTRHNRNAIKIIRAIKTQIHEETSGKVQYIVCVNADTLTSLKTITGKTMIALAVKFGKTRLIDNIIFQA